MLDEGIFTWLTHDVIYAMSSKEWLVAAFHLACDGIVSGKAEVESTNNGIWRISCESMQTVASLVDLHEVKSRLFQLNQKRRLPELKRLVLVPPMGVGSPIAMMNSIPFKQMPEHLWLKFAWKMSVDPETASSSELIGVKDGVWQVRCYSDHAWQFLQNKQHIMKMLVWISRLRKLPEIHNIQVFLGELRT
ncbi:MAG: hypothetical protein IJU23_14990 [Proteobacteria bacterium]|nr:hypothetical protein [Pseudomonadota bacterium]